MDPFEQIEIVSPSWQYSAPIANVKNSVVERYYNLIRFLSLPLFLLLVLGIGFLASSLNIWWVAVALIVLPFNFLVWNWLGTAALYSAFERSHPAKIVFSEKGILEIKDDKSEIMYPWSGVERLQVIYTGHKSAFGQKGKFDKNELNFRYHGRNIRISFKLLSARHKRSLIEILPLLKNACPVMQEYNAESGLAVASSAFEV